MKKGPGEVADKLLAKLAKSKKYLAEATLHNRIGEAVCELLKANESISAATLIAKFEGDVANCPSARGVGAPEHDLARLAAEAVIRHLRSLATAPSGAPNKNSPA